MTLHTQTMDRFGRTVAEVIACTHLNLTTVEDGQVLAYRRFLGQCEAKAYLEAETRASRRRSGVWQGPIDITPPLELPPQPTIGTIRR